MNRFLTMKRLSLMFFALFAVLVTATLLAQRFWIEPEEKCENQGRWWYAEERRCVTPTYLPDITGRPAGMSRAEASNAKNRELIEIERGLAAEKAARQLATEKARAELKANESL